MNPADSYTCAVCGETFFKGQTDKEALAEARTVWGDVPPEDMALVCDDCWKKLPVNLPIEEIRP